jgi:hypothetical protein
MEEILEYQVQEMIVMKMSQVILNKDTPLACEPTLLPAPNHVMVNHMYALSIKVSISLTFY